MDRKKQGRNYGLEALVGGDNQQDQDQIHIRKRVPTKAIKDHCSQISFHVSHVGQNIPVYTLLPPSGGVMNTTQQQQPPKYLMIQLFSMAADTKTD
jgi:hypothetical protein